MQAKALSLKWQLSYQNTGFRRQVLGFVRHLLDLK